MLCCVHTLTRNFASLIPVLTRDINDGTSKQGWSWQLTSGEVHLAASSSLWQAWQGSCANWPSLWWSGALFVEAVTDQKGSPFAISWTDIFVKYFTLARFRIFFRFYPNNARMTFFFAKKIENILIFCCECSEKQSWQVSSNILADKICSRTHLW